MTIPAQSYKKSAIHQKAKDLAVRLIKHYSGKKLSWTERHLADQLIRAATSIGANLVEGYGRHYRQDYRRFLSISRGSSFEVEFWIEIIQEASSNNNSKFLTEIDELNQEIIKMLTAMMKKLEK